MLPGRATWLCLCIYEIIMAAVWGRAGEITASGWGWRHITDHFTHVGLLFFSFKFGQIPPLNTLGCTCTVDFILFIYIINYTLDRRCIVCLWYTYTSPSKNAVMELESDSIDWFCQVGESPAALPPPSLLRLPPSLTHFDIKTSPISSLTTDQLLCHLDPSDAH